MTSFKTLRRKLMKKLLDLPEYKKHEQVPGMGMTWWQLAEKMQRSKHIGNVKALVRKAEEVGLV